MILETSWLGHGLTTRERRSATLDICYSWARSVHQGIANRRACAGRYHLIRYEDLVSSTREVMEQAARFLEVEMHETLVKPTVWGVPFRINSTESTARVAVGTVVTSQVHRYRRTLTSDEIALVEGLVGASMAACGYEVDGPAGPGLSISKYGGSGASGWLKRAIKTRKLAIIQRAHRNARLHFIGGELPNPEA